MTVSPALKEYASNAERLRSKLESVSAAAVLAPITDLLPSPPALCLDIGAGTGRDAKWMCDNGYSVTAVEPTQGFHSAIRENAPHAKIAADPLPGLADLSPAFDVALAVAVWHHIPPDDRKAAYERLSQLIGVGGRLFMSLRHGPVIPERGVHQVDAVDEITKTCARGWRVIRNVRVASQGDANIAAGIEWTWLGFEREHP